MPPITAMVARSNVIDTVLFALAAALDVVKVDVVSGEDVVRRATIPSLLPELQIVESVQVQLSSQISQDAEYMELQ